MKSKILVFILLVFSCISQNACHAEHEVGVLNFFSPMKPKQYFDKPLQRSFASAVKSEDLDMIKELIAKGADVNAQGAEGMRPLFLAATRQKLESFELLLRNGADPNVTAERVAQIQLYEDSPMTRKLPLMELLVAIDDSRYLRLALEHGGDPNTKAQFGGMLKGLTVLFAAIREGYIQNVEVLVNGGADVNFLNPPSSHSPLTESANRSRYDITKLLIQNGAAPEKITGHSPDNIPISFALNVKRFGFIEHFSLSQEERLEQRGHYLDVVKYLKNRELLEENFDPWFVENKAKGKTEIIIYEDRPEWWPDFPKK